MKSWYFAIIFIVFSPVLRAGTPDHIGFIDGLLSLTPTEVEKPREPDKKFTKNSLPPECEITSPLEAFIDCWSSYEFMDLPRNTAVVDRITANFEKFLPKLPHFLRHNLLRLDGDSSRAVFKIYTRCKTDDCGLGRMREAWLQVVKEQLMLRSDFFVDDLLENAKKVSDQETYIENSKYLAALARQRWDLAKPLIEKLSASNNAHLATFALSLKFEKELRDNSPKHPNRDKLISRSFDASKPKNARTLAIEQLLKQSWDGQDDYFLKLFDADIYRWDQAPSLFEFAKKNPDKWVPKIVTFVNNPNRNRHNNAVDTLVEFNLKNARKDALKPLLPWLENPKWSRVNGMGRLRIIQSLDLVGLVEGVSGLLWVVKNDSDESYVSYAAETLAHLQASEAVPLLKKRLATIKDSGDLRRMVEAINDLNGYGTDDSIRFLQAYANAISTPAKEQTLYKSLQTLLDSEIELDKEAFVGYVLSANPKNAAAIGKKILKTGTVNDDLLSVIASWRIPAVDYEILRRLSAGTMNYRAVAGLLTAYGPLDESARKRLQPLIDAGGYATGVIAMLERNEALFTTILQSEDTKAKASLLAAARFIKQKLDLPAVAKHMGSEDTTLAKAARQYLTADDSPQSRSLLQANTKGNEIFGSRMSYDPGHVTYPEFNAIEKTLLTEIENGEAEEVFALLSSGYWGGEGQIIIRRTGDSVKLAKVLDQGRYFSGVVSSETWKHLNAFMANNRIDDLAPLETYIADGIQYEFVHLKKQYGRRVFMNNPGASDGIYNTLVNEFVRLSEGADLQLHYRAIDIDSEGRVLSRSDRPHAWEEYLKKYQTAESECAKMKYMQEKATWQSRYKGKPLYIHDGFFQCEKEKPKKYIFKSKGNYGDPVVTKDNKWLVAAKTDTHWAVPNYAVVINLITKAEKKIDLPPADNYNVVAYVEERNRVLLVRYKDDPKVTKKPVGPDKPTYYLLDPETRKTEIVDGDLAPYQQHGQFPLQAATKKHFTWVARPDYETRSTEVGLYDMRNFVFQHWRTIKDFVFTSRQMWVDEEKNLILIDTRNDLLQFPLRGGS